MRKEQEIANEIETRRANLKHDLGQLRTMVDEKIEVVRRAKDQVDSRRQQLMEMRDNTSAKIRERPVVAVGAAFAVGALLGLMRGR